MTPALEVVEGAATAARRVAELVSEQARADVAARGRFTLALSKAPPALVEGIAGLPWAETTLYQADERVAPAGHEDRNLTAILAALPPEARPLMRPMPVEELGLEQAAERYAAELPWEIDLVHLGLGPDGHTASLVPGDPVLDVHDRLVAVTAEYEGYRRLTLTYAALDAARRLVWLVAGEAKRDALARLLAGDESIPATRISNPRQLVVADAAAAPDA